MSEVDEFHFGSYEQYPPFGVAHPGSVTDCPICPEPAVQHDRLPHVIYASDTPPSWAVVDYGNDVKPAARIVGMFYGQGEAAQYTYWRRKHLTTLAAVRETGETK